MPSLALDWLLEGPYGLLVALVVIGGGTALNYLRTRREKMLSFRVRFNSRLGFDPPDAGNVVRLIGPDHTEIPDPGMVVARIKNVGRSSITEQDYVHRLGLTFPGTDRRLVTVDVTEARPPDLQDLLTGEGFEVHDNRIVLPRVHLNPGSEFKLVALLEHTSGTGKPAVQTNGILRNGRIFLDSDGRRLRRSTLIGAGLSTLLAGALVAVLLVGLPPDPRAECAEGELTVNGSSAFADAVRTLAGQYMERCRGSRITVDASGSIEGLNELDNAPPEDGPRRLTLADGRFDGGGEFPNVEIAGTLAVVPFSFVVHPALPVTDVPRAELAKVFRGDVSNWNEITLADGTRGPDTEVRVVGRTSTSGSRTVIQKLLLDGDPPAGNTVNSCAAARTEAAVEAPIICEVSSTGAVIDAVSRYEGAIGYVDMPNAVAAGTAVTQLTVDGLGATLDDLNDGYPIWTVEYLYSHGPLAETADLTRSFAGFLVDADQADEIQQLGYPPCVQVGSVPQGLCSKGN
ncbi:MULTISPECIES: PstS family phosphate ABC transporter substrate-binding protein [Catenuloplanes]|uniref:Phosphate transport system substrate-binding protein n=1 Tax=Catenuloplanes niger TaxID=587534 RepID=A0AAE3ZY98_9ACTN|nr:substrate-binding domain-containing protein [Catenuloplanes niger]MDR7328141.1 phosphate transport system substrate-binding protein [Catenuloplanes niger]